MASSEIKYTIFEPEDPFTLHTKQPYTMIVAGYWPECEGSGRTCAETVCEEYFDTNTWIEFFGEDEDGGTIAVEILEPVTARGVYDVSLERVTKAQALPMKDPCPKVTPTSSEAA